MTNAQVEFDCALGSTMEYARLAAAAVGGAKLKWLLLKATGLEADATLQTYTTVAALLAAANDEASVFTGYARLNVTAGHITVTVDTTNHWVTVDISDDPSWTPSGTAESLGKIVLYYDPTGSSADSACIPLFADSFIVTTGATPITYQIASGGFAKDTH